MQVGSFSPCGFFLILLLVEVPFIAVGEMPAATFCFGKSCAGSANLFVFSMQVL
jgi:hypothetical protein